MRTNSMTKCAVGAMLFGGTLGLAQTASAGVTVSWFNSLHGSNAMNSIYDGSTTFSNQSFSPGATIVATTFNDDGIQQTASLTYTAPAASAPWQDSFTVSVSAGPNAPGYPSAGSSEIYRLFSIVDAPGTGSMADYSFTMSDISPGSQNPVTSLEKWDGLGWVMVFLTPNLAAFGTYTGVLGVGDYRLFNRSEFYVAPGGVGFSASEVFAFNIPAPGATALLGAAGLLGSRRRRN